MNGSAESRIIATTRRVPRRYRRVRFVTTQTFRTDSTALVRSPDQVSEHRVEGIVWTLEAADFELRVRNDRGELAVEGIRLARPDEQGVFRRNLQGDDVLHPRQGLRELARLRRLEPHRVRVLVNQQTDRMNVARRDRLAVVNEHDVVRNALDLVQDMRRHEDVAALLGEIRDRSKDLDAGHRIGARQGLVQDEHLRIMGEGLCELRPLSHPATVRPRGTVRGACQADNLERVGRRLRGLVRGHPVETEERFDELLAAEPAIQLVVLRAIAEASLQRDVVPRILPEETHVALIRVELADEQFEQRALARAVRPDEDRDSRTERGGERVESEDLPVPLRDARSLDDTAQPETTSTAFIRM